MSPEMQVLMISAITISILHTLAGPDHYLPFIVLSRSKKWSLRKTITWTILCGCGHVVSSVLLGLGAALLGWSLSSAEWLNSIRGGIAGWCLFSFGLIYVIIGIIHLNKNRSHKHFDVYDDNVFV